MTSSEADPPGADYAVEREVRQAQAPTHLGARHADAVVGALLQLEPKATEGRGNLLEVVRDHVARDEQDARQIVDSDPFGARKQVVQKVVHAGLGRGGDGVLPRMGVAGAQGRKRRGVDHLERIASPALLLDLSASGERLVRLADV